MHQHICWCKKAVEFNEDFESRRTAVDYLPGISEECLKNYESGKTPPNSDVISIMAEAYNAKRIHAHAINDNIL